MDATMYNIKLIIIVLVATRQNAFKSCSKHIHFHKMHVTHNFVIAFGFKRRFPKYIYNKYSVCEGCLCLTYYVGGRRRHWKTRSRASTSTEAISLYYIHVFGKNLIFFSLFSICEILNFGSMVCFNTEIDTFRSTSNVSSKLFKKPAMRIWKVFNFLYRFGTSRVVHSLKIWTRRFYFVCFVRLRLNQSYFWWLPVMPIQWHNKLISSSILAWQEGEGCQKYRKIVWRHMCTVKWWQRKFSICSPYKIYNVTILRKKILWQN